MMTGEVRMSVQLFTLPTQKASLPLRLAHGHFATSHSHINYYLDLAKTKHRLSEAKEVATELCSKFKTSKLIDTILCLDGTEVIGTCMAYELTQSGYANMNAHRTIYVVTPEHTTGSQLFFRENTAPMIQGKHVLVLAASTVTGFTVHAAVDAIRYYNGYPEGICSIFTCIDECMGFPITSVYSKKEDLDDYMSCPSTDCPLCKKGIKLDGLVNSFGISSF